MKCHEDQVKLQYVVKSQWLSRLLYKFAHVVGFRFLESYFISDRSRLAHTFLSMENVWKRRVRWCLLSLDTSRGIDWGKGLQYYSMNTIEKMHKQDIIRKFVSRGVYFQKFNLTLFADLWANFGQISGQNTVKEWSEHKIKVIFNSAPLKPLGRLLVMGIIYEF